MRPPGWRRPVFLAAGLLLLTAVHAAPAQLKQISLKPVSPAFLEGTEVFRRLLFDAGQDLFDKGFQPLGSFNELDDPRHSIVIFFGDADRLTEVPGGPRNFVDRGGVLFVATDRRPSPPAAVALEEAAGVRVSGRPMVCDDHDACYHELPYCPYLMPFDDADLFRNIDPINSMSFYRAVATNVPSFLRRAPEEDVGVGPVLPKLAALPFRSHEEGAAPPGLLATPLFAVGGDVGDAHGRVLVMADHSIFINEMMLQQDNGNIEFAYNCVKWLAGDEAERRTKVLFVEDGRINARFEVPLKEMPDELANKLLDFFVNHLPEVAQKATPALERDLKQFDQHGGADNMVLRFLGRLGVSPPLLLRGAAVALAVLVALYGCWKVGWRARHRSDRQRPLLASALYRLAPAGGVPEQRQKALIHGDNLWEPARDLARQVLTAAGVPAGPAAPRVEARGGWLRRWTMAGRVKRLWRLAYGPPARVPLGEWRRLLRDVKRLQAAMADGTVRIM